MSTTAGVKDVGASKAFVGEDTVQDVHPHVAAQTAKDVMYFLLAFRIINALALRTFFQPDEYFQSLEPAWQIAFGEQSNAWITWEWRHQLRSSIHPLLFGALYYAVSLLSRALHLPPSLRAELLLAAPKVTQAVFAASMDYYTWKLAEKVYGRSSRAAQAALILTIASPWQWFSSTRTFSNSLETTITIFALYHWPWHWVLEQPARRSSERTVKPASPVDDSRSLRTSLILAAVAVILRPTNVLIWITTSAYTCLYAPRERLIKLVSEATLCGSLVATTSILVDRIYYGVWTFPAFRFLYFNVAQSLAGFYGKNRPDYYLTEGLPLLLTTALPFALVGLYRALGPGMVQVPFPTLVERVPKSLAWTVMTTVFTLSLIGHKEVRFIYPLLPLLQVLAAGPTATFFRPFPKPTARSKQALLVLLLGINIGVGYYTSFRHQRGVVDVISFIRHQHQDKLEKAFLARVEADPDTYVDPQETAVGIVTTVGFLMPCHSTLWRSHLVYPAIDAWALSCEPPVNMTPKEKETYLDEADQFYADPEAWLEQNMGKVPGEGSKLVEALKTAAEGRRDWPEYLVFFEQLEHTMQSILGETPYHECWRGFNSDWHDDGRRKGDVIAWCVQK